MKLIRLRLPDSRPAVLSKSPSCSSIYTTTQYHAVTDCRVCRRALTTSCIFHSLHFHLPFLEFSQFPSADGDCWQIQPDKFPVDFHRTLSQNSSRLLRCFNGLMIEQNLTSHWTHYRSFQGESFQAIYCTDTDNQ